MAEKPVIQTEFDFELPLGIERKGKICKKVRMRRLKGRERILLQKAYQNDPNMTVFGSLARSIVAIEGEEADLTAEQVADLYLTDINFLGRKFAELNDAQSVQGESGASLMTL